MATTTKMTALIFESKAGTSQHIRHLLNEFGDIDLLGITNHLSSGLELIKKYKPDIFFLDEQILGEENGFSLFELSKQFPQTCFILSCLPEDKPSMGSKFSVSENMDSHFDLDRIRLIIDRIKADNKIDNIQNQLDKLSHNRRYEKVMLTTKTGYLFLNPKKIVFCKAESNYTKVTLLNEKSIIVTKSLCHFYEETLCFPQFIRINRSTVINKRYLIEVLKADRKCVLEATKQTYSFTVSPEYYKLLKNNNFSRCASINESMPSHKNMLSLINKDN